MPMIARLLRTLDGRFRAMRWFVFVPCMALADVSAAAFTGLLQDLTGTFTSAAPDLLGHGWIFALLVVSVCAPLIETALFQFLLLRLLGKIRVLPRWAAVLLSAFLFAAQHYYSIDYVIRMIPVGLIFAYAFVVRDKPGGHPYWSVAAIHSLSNTTILGIVFVALKS